MFTTLGIGLTLMAFFHLIVHAYFKATVCTGIIHVQTRQKLR